MQKSISGKKYNTFGVLTTKRRARTKSIGNLNAFSSTEFQDFQELFGIYIVEGFSSTFWH